MSTPMEDSNVKALAETSATLQLDYQSEDHRWEESPFGWIKQKSSSEAGAIGKKLVAGWLAKKGFEVIRSRGADADWLINRHRSVVKFSTLWKNGSYRFQQLRDQDYEFAICLGISPFTAHCWVLPKTEIMRRWRDNDGIRTQHAGARGTDTAWFRVVADRPAPWLSGFGGNLSSAIQVLADHLR